MKSRGLVVGIAVVLAAAAAAFVLLYMNGVKNDAATGGSLSTVLVSNQDIPANTQLNPLIDKGVFSQLKVPGDAVVDGAITDVSQLKGLTTIAPILANEQIPASRLDTGKEIEGGALGIGVGHVAVSVSVPAQAAVNGAVTRGDYVTVYTTFDNPKVIPGTTPAQQIQQASKSNSTQGSLPTMTVTLIPAARVLDIVNPTVDESGRSTGSQVTLTLDLTPTDAQELVYAQQSGTTWLGLLPPNDTTGHSIPFAVIPLNRLLGKA
jgi:Flp pilus assembly protein CpaB